MKSSHLQAETYGVGQLISQKKRFIVPPHQRDYAWTLEEVDTFVDDIVASLDRGADDYFIGLIVLHGPFSGSWRILDGQQRLATVTMLFAAVREWLRERGLDRDANQIDEEFVALRRLGKESISRMTLNESDQPLFQEVVLKSAPIEAVLDEGKVAPKGSSIRKLAQAAAACREFVSQYAKASRLQSDAVDRVYKLTQFIDESLRVVCLEVGSEADAFVIFESLNNRGHDLSALDLVKNHIYGRVEELGGGANSAQVAEAWQEMVDVISERKADDFLKVFWTSLYGRIQRASLYTEIKESFQTLDQVRDLSSLLSSSAAPYVATEDSSNPIWSAYDDDCVHYIDVLTLLRSRQVRPIVLAAIRNGFDVEEMRKLLHFLVSLTVRYQTIGRKRTGKLEIECAQAARSISIGANSFDVVHQLSHVVPDDEEFAADFLRYSEGISKRAIYILLGLEAVCRFGKYHVEFINQSLADSPSVRFARVLPKQPQAWWGDVLSKDPDLLEEAGNRLANYVLVEESVAHKLLSVSSRRDVGRTLAESEYRTTHCLGELLEGWDRSVLQSRQNELAQLACQAWVVSPE